MVTVSAGLRVSEACDSALERVAEDYALVLKGFCRHLICSICSTVLICCSLSGCLQAYVLAGRP